MKNVFYFVRVNLGSLEYGGYVEGVVEGEGREEWVRIGCFLGLEVRSSKGGSGFLRVFVFSVVGFIGRFGSFRFVFFGLRFLGWDIGLYFSEESRTRFGLDLEF